MPRPASDSNLSSSGERVGGNANQGSASGSSNRSGGGGNGGGYSAGGASGRYNSRSQLAGSSPITSDALERVRDYENVDNSFLDNVGNFFAGAFGVNEINPVKSNLSHLMGGTRPGTRADWGFDPAGAIGGALGMGLGIPGLGIIADQISGWAGRPLEINMGPDLFGGAFGGGTPAAVNATAPSSPPAQQGAAAPPVEQGSRGMPELANLATTNPALYAQVSPYLATRPGFRKLSLMPQYQAGAFA